MDDGGKRQEAQPPYCTGTPKTPERSGVFRFWGPARLDPTDPECSASTPERSTSTSEHHTQYSEVLAHLYESVSTPEFFGSP
ncbi:hypothetical protein RSOLAG1IB_11013 [Rhizoctonia solani AG-1 IB]|uniref:Uncharacterized protein n=1 Tax=Thanatephorus cucumeris (strain AG1-IB / isolate 7/3/14) TaxID=1108050 RepID=A0A0B7G4J2_THACB|nr:hypothetical protein RSOLAG1IB_11013 [Rhizoctonia solani AG-1 IB]